MIYYETTKIVILITKTIKLRLQKGAYLRGTNDRRKKLDQRSLSIYLRKMLNVVVDKILAANSRVRKLPSVGEINADIRGSC